jgi:predicted ATPase
MMQSVVNIDEESQLNTALNLALDQEAEDLVDINSAAPASSNKVNDLYKVDNPPSIKSKKKKKKKKKLALEGELMASCLKEIKKSATLLQQFYKNIFYTLRIFFNKYLYSVAYIIYY